MCLFAIKYLFLTFNNHIITIPKNNERKKVDANKTLRNYVLF